MFMDVYKIALLILNIKNANEMDSGWMNMNTSIRSCK